MNDGRHILPLGEDYWYEIFELRCVLNNVDVKLCARVEGGVKQLLALVTSNSDIILHYSYGELPPTVKRVSWFSDSNKSIQAISFDPTATWLLATSLDSSIFIIPALSLVDKKQKVDCKWSTTDVTQFSRHQHSPCAKPTAILWWQTLDCNQNALVGYETGEIALISLTDGRCLGTCSVRCCITSLYLCQDNNFDTVSLLINGENGQQWRLLLEHHSLGYLWPPDANSYSETGNTSLLNNLKLMGIRQLNNFKRRLREARDSKLFPSSSDTDSTDSLSELTESTENSSLEPELLPHLTDTTFAPQYARNRHMFSAFCRSSGLFTIHAADMESAPLDVYQLPVGYHSILLTDYLVYGINEDNNCLAVISPKSVSDNCSYMILAKFTTPNKDEKVQKLFKSTSLAMNLESKKDESKEKTYVLPKTVDEIKIQVPKIDTCVIVTNCAVYKLILRICPIKYCIQRFLEDRTPMETVSLVFTIPLDCLFEATGDIFLSNGDYTNCLLMYKHGGVDPLKKILKVAMVADCRTLLKAVTLLLNSKNLPVRNNLSIAAKMHIGNLAVMGYTELILRTSGVPRITNTKDFMTFLQYVEYYDQILAVNVACQAGLWNILVLLAKTRGLQIEVTAALCQLLQAMRAPPANDPEFALALSEPTLIQSFLMYPNYCQVILNYVRANLNCFSVNVLKRFAMQLDPSQPGMIQCVSRLFQKTNDQLSSFESTLDSVDFENSDRSVVVVKEIIEAYVCVLIGLVQKTCVCRFDLSLLENMPRPEPPIQEATLKQFPDLKSLACGFEHAAIIRNNCVYTMGVSSNGCLGTGPLLTQSSPAKPVQALIDLRVKALSVSCGKKHTLVLTDCGVYSWGSNHYGQLGLGPLLQESPNPQLITALTAKIVDVVCGQYHSMALTSSGQVYTWGWGIHGQLGHGTCDNEYYPKLLSFKHKIVQIAAGQAHSLILVDVGKLYGFGSNAFGQLESCRIEESKTSRPVRIWINTEAHPLLKINSAYFQNIAIRQDQKVIVWGATPQEVRVVQSKQAAKRPTDDLDYKRPVFAYEATEREPLEQVATGYRHIVFIQGKKLFFGKYKDSKVTQIRLSTQPVGIQRFIEIACGTEYSLTLEQNGKIYAFGKMSLTQTILGQPADSESTEGAVVYFKNTKRIIKLPNSVQYGDSLSSEVTGIPTMAITYSTTDPRKQLNKNAIPYSILSIENNSYQPKIQKPPRKNANPLDYLYAMPDLKLEHKTLHYVLEVYHDFYDTENVIARCLEVGNFQAAGKVSMLDGHYSDSLGFQLAAFKLHMDKFTLNFPDISVQNEINERLTSVSEKNSPAHILSSSSSLDSIRQWGDEMEHQGGCESPCQPSEMGDVRQNMSQYVASLKTENSPPISSVSKMIDAKEKVTQEKSEVEVYVKDEESWEIINTAAALIEFYTQKIYSSENHILMQNVLMKCIEFWLVNNLPVVVLENVLLKNMDKYFYPLSILLFCKNFNNNVGEEIVKKDDVNKRNSAGFLRQFSTKFCLQLCSMVLENVNKA